MLTTLKSFPRLSLCLTVSLLSACGDSGTKPEWSQVVYTDTPVLMGYPNASYQYPVAQSVMRNVLPHATGYGISLFPERADYFDDSVFVTLGLTGQIVDRKAVLPLDGVLHRSASGHWVQDSYGRVTAIDAKGALQWQTQVSPTAVSNATGENADFISAFQATHIDEATQRNVVTLTLTGFGEQGEILWQQAHAHSAANSYQWVFAHDEQGQLCYVEDTHYRTVQSVVVRRAANGNLSNALVGRLSKFQYEKNGECVKRCAGFDGAMVLTDIAAQPEGRLITAWANSMVDMMVGDLETNALAPFRRSVVVAFYAPVVPQSQ